jgi:hypothetical protein
MSIDGSDFFRMRIQNGPRPREVGRTDLAQLSECRTLPNCNPVSRTARATKSLNIPGAYKSRPASWAGYTFPRRCTSPGSVLSREEVTDDDHENTDSKLLQRAQNTLHGVLDQHSPSLNEEASDNEFG